MWQWMWQLWNGQGPGAAARPSLDVPAVRAQPERPRGFSRGSAGIITLMKS